MASLWFVLAVMSQLAVFIEAGYGDRDDFCMTALTKFRGPQTDDRGACMDMNDPERINMDYWCDETGPCSTIIQDVVDYCEGNAMLLEETYEQLKGMVCIASESEETGSAFVPSEESEETDSALILNNRISAIFAGFAALAILA
eukprot:gnl/TRDRNA2_/TRDRNA2_119650_c0_seq1.p1 gnl/TRDRNA2_/TRDRNA2_119650_c0~~gnl/TRDRNA2_/TRDRNA2_119650_c0_seq1.p1  ORF type:complete len:144 (-),score=27.63 gnl/TRDRNA2_/TRDRNA2_119650_c0_seq1:353-784(-)